MSVKRYDLVTIYRGHESRDEMEDAEDGTYVRHDDYAELEARCAALAAENEAIKFYLRNGPVIRKGGELAAAHQFAPETPATNAFLVEVRASALDEFAKAQDEQAKKYYEMSPGCSAQDECQFAASQAWYFAECIRKGVQS